MEKAGLAAHRTVALTRFDLDGREYFEAQAAAVAPTPLFDPLITHQASPNYRSLP
jgi:hypothetical protein